MTDTPSLPRYAGVDTQYLARFDGRSAQPGKPAALAIEPKSLNAQEAGDDYAGNADPGRGVPPADHHVPSPDEAKQMHQSDQEENDARCEGVSSRVHGLPPLYFHSTPNDEIEKLVKELMGK